MFIDVTKESAQIDMLFYVAPDVDVSPSSVSDLERSFSRYWNAEIRLFLCPRSVHRNYVSKRKLYGTGIFSFLNQLGYIDTSGTQQVQAFEGCLSRGPDAIFVHRLGSMCPLLLVNRTLPKVFFDLDDIEHVAFARGIGQLSKWRSRLLSYAYLPALLLGELRAIRSADLTFVCSEVDRRYLTDRFHLKHVVTIPNAVAMPEGQPVTPDSTLLFIGSYRYKPNIDAAQLLIENVWPRVYSAIPEARLIIAGAPPERIPGYGLNIPGVKFTGFVKDLDALYRQSRVVCAPIRSGGGTRVKIIEAAAYGKAIVSTRLGAEGIQMRDGQELLLRDDPQSFAEACIQLIQDYSLCQRLGAAARARAIQSYDRDKVMQLIQKYMTNGHSSSPFTNIS
jgi:glycosyltransferase involved in cell wall biosynthesis